MSSKILRLATGIAALALAACAGDPFIVKASGSLPASGSFAAAAEDETATPILPLFLDRLEHRGLSRSDEPDYLVQLAASRRPRPVGLFVPEASPDWLRSPARGPGDLPTLVFTVSERASGRELYRAAIIVRHPRAGDDPVRLVDAVLPGMSEGQTRSGSD